MITFEELPPVMAERARWAREEILKGTALANPRVQIDEDELLAWVYKDEDELWYSVDGNYSYSSPKEKMTKRRERAKKQDEYQNKIDDEVIKKYAHLEYWSKVRKKILKRDKNVCQICKKTGATKLHIHHVLKIRCGGEDFYDNLITACPKCHSAADRKLYDPEWTQP